MESHLQLTDTEFEQQFKTGALDPTVFNHEAHLRLAWIHITRYGLDQAVENICAQLLNFVKAVGAEDKYNKTLTIAAVKAVYHFINKSDADNFNDFIEQNPRLKYNFRQLIAAHYGIDVFNSETAKREYVEPDLLPFT